MAKKEEIKNMIIKNANKNQLPNVCKKEVKDEEKEVKLIQCNSCLPCNNILPLDTVNQKFKVDNDYNFIVPCYNPPPTDYLRVLTYDNETKTFIINVKPIYK